MTNELRNIIGSRGEKIVELCLTDFSEFPAPLFRPCFLGDKWPSIDLYVELSEIREMIPYFFAQVKTTTLELTQKQLCISTKKKDILNLLKIPAPTYILGVHEPSHRVFIHSIHKNTPAQAITRIPLEYELNSSNLRQLEEEVHTFWNERNSKPEQSIFS